MSQSSQAPQPDRSLERDLAVLRGEPSDVAPQTGGPRRGGRLLLLFVVLAIAAFFGWRHLDRPAAVNVTAVSWRNVGSPPVLLSASGYLEARRQITLSSKAQGRIVEMPVRESQRIRVGDLIARLESDEARASLNLAAAELTDAQRELERVVKLAAGRAASEAALDRARTQRDVARARRDLARVAFDNREIRAPIDGTVIRKIRDVGEFLTIGVTAEGDPGTAVATLADLSALDVSLEVGETEISKVKIGAVALVTPEAAPRQRYLADVTEIASMADRQKGAVAVTVRIREPDAALLPDMSASVSFLESEPSGPIEVLRSVPVSAIVSQAGGRAVFVIEDGRATLQAVEGFEFDDGAFALREGPEAGTPVVENPPAGLRDGDRVQLDGA